MNEIGNEYDNERVRLINEDINEYDKERVRLINELDSQWVWQTTKEWGW